MLIRLHKEIVDFYDYVRPCDFEERIRNEVVDDLKKYCRKMWSDAEVYAFGSFPTGLYLPTSDMDLVVVSDSRLYKNGPAKYDNKKSLFRLGNCLIRTDKVRNKDEAEFIVCAKVPLVKFVDRRTRLKVDISFENTGGLQAVKMFTAWKEQYPVIPTLVTLIKHLCMRGLNKPVNGGIGGFSVIYLVVSMLQVMLQVQSRSMDQMHHLGDLLMHRLELYDHNSNYKYVANCLNPSRYIAKDDVRDFPYKHRDRLSIIDPNNPSNDIAGGSKLIHDITATFREASKSLQEEMALAMTNPDPHHSILKKVFSGN